MSKVRRARSTASDDFDLLRLENQLCFALYAASRAITRTYREKLEPIGLTYPQYLVLLVLWEHDALSVSDIGDRLMLDSGTLTPLIKRLEGMGLVKRKRSNEDEREVIVHPTQKAMELRDEALAARKFVACRLDMSEKEILALRCELMVMISKLGEECETEAAE